MTRRGFGTTPLIDAVVDEVRRNIDHKQEMTMGDVLEWIFLDISMYPDDSPASGRMSPSLHSIMRQAYAKVGGVPGDMDSKDRPYRGAFLDRTKPRVVGSET